MDTTATELQFDDNGRCHLCRAVEESMGTTWFMDEQGLPHLEDMVDQMLREGRSAEYDCILGLSGGLDSSYAALKLHDWGVRPLVVHVDAGWNSELAVRNVQSILEYCGWDLHTHVVNWEDMRRLQIAYMRSGVPNQDVPQDHAFFAALYKFATDNGVRYVISGGNMATEGVFPPDWHHDAMDAKNIRAIWSKFGDGELVDYPTISFFQYYVWFPKAKRMKILRPLNLIPYRAATAKLELQERIGYRPYPRKHGESIFTRYFQNYYLPARFGYDSRLPHLSSLIVSGQLSRKDALSEMEEPLYDREELARDQAYLIQKLRLTDEEFDRYLATPRRRAEDFPNWNRTWNLAKSTQQMLADMTRRPRGIPS